MSPGAVRALNTPMTEGYNDSAVWVAKGVNLIGALVPDMVAGGVARKVGDVTLRKMLTAGLEKKIHRGRDAAGKSHGTGSRSCR